MAPRKTTTSTEVKRRYNDKVYSRIVAELPKDTVAAFKAKCKERGVSQARVILDAIENFLTAAFRTFRSFALQIHRPDDFTGADVADGQRCILQSTRDIGTGGEINMVCVVVRVSETWKKSGTVVVDFNTLSDVIACFGDMRIGGDEHNHL